jgi:hypothetical protein
MLLFRIALFIFCTGDTYHAYNVHWTAAIRKVRPMYACSEHRGTIEMHAIEKIAACAT